MELTQDATLRVSRIEGTELRHAFEPQRLGFLFVAGGGAEAAGLDANDNTAGAVELGAGDAVRFADITRLDLRGAAEVVLWDLPQIQDGERA